MNFVRMNLLIYMKSSECRVGSHKKGLGESVCFILCFDSVVVKPMALLLSLLTCHKSSYFHSHVVTGANADWN